MVCCANGKEVIYFFFGLLYIYDFVLIETLEEAGMVCCAYGRKVIYFICSLLDIYDFCDLAGEWNAAHMAEK